MTQAHRGDNLRCQRQQPPGIVAVAVHCRFFLGLFLSFCCVGFPAAPRSAIQWLQADSASHGGEKERLGQTDIRAAGRSPPGHRSAWNSPPSMPLDAARQDQGTSRPPQPSRQAPWAKRARPDVVAVALGGKRSAVQEQFFIRYRFWLLANCFSRGFRRAASRSCTTPY